MMWVINLPVVNRRVNPSVQFDSFENKTSTIFYLAFFYFCLMILVTGGTGFVGSHLLYYLVRDGKRVKALKRAGSNTSLTEKIFSCYADNFKVLLSHIEWIEGDILDYFSLTDVFEEGMQVYHTAAMVSFHAADREQLIRTNVEGTANVVNAALEKRIKKLCYVSSVGALGRAGNTGITDEDSHWRASAKHSVYSESKYEAEREVWRGMAEGLNAVIVNPSVIIGPGNWNSGSPQLFQTLWKGLKFYTGGMNGFVDVNDVAKAMIVLMEGDFTEERFIINSENVFYKQFYNWMAKAMNRPEPKYKAGPVLSNIGWRMLAFIKIFTGRPSGITRETARTANQVYRYSTWKFTEATGMEFTPVKESVGRTARLFLGEMGEE